MESINDAIVVLVENNPIFKERRDGANMTVDDTGIPRVNVEGNNDDIRPKRRQSIFKVKNLVANSIEKFREIFNPKKETDEDKDKKGQNENKDLKRDSKDLKRDSKDLKRDSKEIKRDSKEIKRESKEIKRETNDIDNKETKRDTNEINDINENKEQSKEISESKEINSESKEQTSVEESNTNEIDESDEKDLEPKLMKQIIIDQRFQNKVFQCDGVTLVQGGAKMDHFPLYSTYIVFNGSNNFLFVRSIGYICIENKGESTIVLASRKRIILNTKDKEPHFYSLLGEQKCYFDYKGEWCIEIVEGDPLNIAIIDFSTFGGNGVNNKLLMV